MTDKPMKYPVQAGEFWSVGPHKFACIDFMKPNEVRDALAFFGTYEFTTFYADLPYNKGLAKMFYTQAKIQVDHVDFQALMNTVVGFAKFSQTYAFLEIGNENVGVLADTVKFHGGTVLQESDIMYYRTRPAKLLTCTWTDWILERYPLPDLTGVDDAKTPAVVIEAVKQHVQLPMSVFDPCTGLGTTPIAAAKEFSIGYGFELVPARLSATLEKLAKITKQEPVREGQVL